MKETKIKERFGNAIDAFFNDEKLSENASLSVACNRASFNLGESEALLSISKHKLITKILRQIFLFLPGAFFLYMVPLSFVYFSSLFNIGLNGYLGFMFWLLAGSFLTLVGIGSLKETKNLIVPVSIISFSLILGILFLLFPEPLRGSISGFYSIYLFPAALMLAGLAKTWVNEK
jgi:hypothetical protein